MRVPSAWLLPAFTEADRACRASRAAARTALSGSAPAASKAGSTLWKHAEVSAALWDFRGASVASFNWRKTCTCRSSHWLAKSCILVYGKMPLCQQATI